MVVTGHTHSPTSATYLTRTVADWSRAASSFGRLYTETELNYDQRSPTSSALGQGLELVVTRDVAKAPEQTRLINLQELVAPIANRYIGSISGDVTRTDDGSGESGTR